MKTKKNDERLQLKLNNLNMAKKLIKHPVVISSYDKYTLEVDCTEKEHSNYCAKLGCSGFYSNKLKKGFLLNFNEYK